MVLCAEYQIYWALIIYINETYVMYERIAGVDFLKIFRYSAVIVEHAHCDGARTHQRRSHASPNEFSIYSH